jgi:hypothetical protein
MTFNFISGARAETLKLRRANALWLTLGGAGFIPLVNCIKLVGKPDVFVPRVKADPWGYIIHDHWAPAASFLLPLYLILVISLVAQIEYGNNTWKQVYATPRTYADIFFSKFIVVNGLILLCFILFTALMIASAYTAWALNQDYHFTSSPIPWLHVLTVPVRMYVSTLGIVAIQFVLSIGIKNFITPMAIGMALVIGGFMIRQWEYIAYYTYMHPLLEYFRNPGLEGSTADRVLIISPLTAAPALIVGFCWMRWKKEKG